MTHCPTCLAQLKGNGWKRGTGARKGGAYRKRTYCGRKCRANDRKYLRRR